jgi:hypothetical protein
LENKGEPLPYSLIAASFLKRKKAAIYSPRILWHWNTNVLLVYAAILQRDLLRIFLDTEFSDFQNPRLISIGLVTEAGQEFYAELSDGWRIEMCSDFVKNCVMPCLDLSAACTMSRADAVIRLVHWLSQLGGKLAVVSDVPVDWLLMANLLKKQNITDVDIQHQVLSWPGAAMARHCQLLLDESLGGDARRHHALVDALALRYAVMQTESDFRK